MTKAQKRALVDLVAASLGGVVGALTTSWLERAGIKRNVAAAGVAAAGGLTVAFTRGTARAAAGGVAAAGAGQLVASWFATLNRRVGSKQPQGEHEPSRRNATPKYSAIQRAFDRAAAQVSESLDEQPEADRVHRDGTDTPAEAHSQDETVSDQPDSREPHPLVIKEPIGAYTGTR